MLNEFSRLTFRKKISTSLGELQTDLEEWLRYYNEARVQQGRWGYGRTPRRTFLDTIPLAKEKLVAAELIGHYDSPDNEENNHTVSDQLWTHYERVPLVVREHSLTGLVAKIPA